MTHTAQALPVFTLLVLLEQGWMDAAATPPQDRSLAAKGKQEQVCRQPGSQCLPRCSGSPTSVQRVNLYFCCMSLMSSWVPAAGGTGVASPLPQPPQTLGCVWGNGSLWKTRLKSLDFLSDRVKSLTQPLTEHKRVVNRRGQGQSAAPDS